MGKFIAKAVVRIEDNSKRMNIFENASVGRIKGILRSENDQYVSFDYTMMAIRGEPEACHFVKVGFIDCNHYANGDEDLAVKLFLALAELRDDSGSDTRWLICDTPHYDDMYNKTFERNEVIDGWRYEHIDQGMFSIATPEEIAEAVKSGEITKEQLNK